MIVLILNLRRQGLPVSAIPHKRILKIPIKEHWRKSSGAELIEAGLQSSELGMPASPLRSWPIGCLDAGMAGLTSKAKSSRGWRAAWGIWPFLCCPVRADPMHSRSPAALKTYNAYSAAGPHAAEHAESAHQSGATVSPV